MSAQISPVEHLVPAEPEGGRRHYRAVFISDLHLGASGSRSEAARAFFQEISCDSLYLVGDIFDGYVGRRKNLGNVAEALRPMLACAPDVYYTPGNHDSFMHRLNGTQYGHLHVAESFEHVRVDGSRLLIIHGDQFDRSCREGWMIAYVGAWAYEFLTRLNKVMNRPRMKRGQVPLVFAAKAKHFVKGAVKKESTYQDELLGLAEERGCSGVVCGHIHRPEFQEVGGLLYINTGDWVENQSVVVEYENGRIELVLGPTMISVPPQHLN